MHITWIANIQDELLLLYTFRAFHDVRKYFF